MRLPSGRLVRGRGLHHGTERHRTAGYGTSQSVAPEFGLYLLSKPPVSLGWQSRWVCWPDLWLPIDRDDAREALLELWRRAEFERVEVACSGGQGRTGTALACLAILDGVPASDAIAYVRRHYSPRAVETLWQRRYVRQFE